MKILVIVELEKHIVNAYILYNIICKFCHRHKLCLVILLLINKSSEISFYSTILFFDLAIYLRIEYYR